MSDALREALEKGLALKGGWREAIVELEDHCSEPVRLRNMLAAADQLDDWAKEARAALASQDADSQRAERATTPTEDIGKLKAAAYTMLQFARDTGLVGCTTAFGVYMRRERAVEVASEIIKGTLKGKPLPASPEKDK